MWQAEEAEGVQKSDLIFNDVDLVSDPSDLKIQDREIIKCQLR
jgi:hypothetical protein